MVLVHRMLIAMLVAVVLCLTASCSDGGPEPTGEHSSKPAAVQDDEQGDEDKAATPSSASPSADLAAKLKDYAKDKDDYTRDSVSRVWRVDTSKPQVSIRTTMAINDGKLQTRKNGRVAMERIMKVYREMTGDKKTPVYVFPADGGALVVDIPDAAR